MNIEFVELKNFRKLQACRIDFNSRQTIFVGANNSGKTSAIDALTLFLNNKEFSVRDFTLSNWKGINAIGESWIKNSEIDKPIDTSLAQWLDHLPQLDIWLGVENTEIQYVDHLIPTLKWKGGRIGVRLRLEPKNIETLFKEFLEAIRKAKTAKGTKTKTGTDGLKLWPRSMWDFLERKLSSYFSIEAYILDPSKCTDPIGGVAQPQILPLDSVRLEGTPFDGLIKIDIVGAQRGFSDPNTETTGLPKTSGNLSTQLREYYKRHLDPSEQPGPEDMDALESIDAARISFDEKLKKSFTPSIKELEELNYPGFGNPSIAIASDVNVIDGLNHGSAVQFGVLNSHKPDPLQPVTLPEKYNGLGYQNLISMVFKLIRFRDEWMQVGKISLSSGEKRFEPLHLVLIEEPEAHLHAQVQQVFIRKAYEVLRNHPLLLASKKFTTQLVISTHSNHIAHEIDFTCLRYFRRIPASENSVSTSIVVNLSKTFGTETETTKFAIRYLKTTHCDLFFADAVILVEGPAERMLVPHFIKNKYQDLASCYISILEIGGSHAHTLQPLIEDLGIITLVITDIDSVMQNSKKHWISVLPALGKGYKTNNATLKQWLPKKDSFDDLIALKSNDKVASKFPVRVSYQIPIAIETTKGKKENAYPYTFEDSLVFSNMETFKKLKGVGLMNKFNTAVNKATIEEASKEMFEALENGKKAEFALELLFLEEPAQISVPSYIHEGLEWLHGKLADHHSSLSTQKIKN